MSNIVPWKNSQSTRLQSATALIDNQSSCEDTFSSMCSNFLETVYSHKVIQDRQLLDFSKLAVQIISNAIEELPESFNTLVKTFLDYLHYSVRNDPDQNRVLSYVRAYQITCMLDVYRMEQKHEELLCEELKTNYQNEDLLFYIFNFPGITSSELQAKLRCSESEINKRTCQLEEKKLLSSHQTEYEVEPYYMLSSLGRDLYRDLREARTHRVMSNQWSHERVFILYILLKTQISSSNDTIPVMTLIRRVSELCEDDVQRFALKMKRHGKKHSLEKDSDEEMFIYYEDFDYDVISKGGYCSERYFGRKENYTISDDQMAQRKYSTDFSMRRCVSGHQYN